MISFSGVSSYVTIAPVALASSKLRPSRLQFRAHVLHAVTGLVSHARHLYSSSKLSPSWTLSPCSDQVAGFERRAS